MLLSLLVSLTRHDIGDSPGLMCLGVDSGKTTDSVDPKKVRCVKNGLFCHSDEYDEDRIFQAGVRRESSMFFCVSVFLRHAF